MPARDLPDEAPRAPRPIAPAGLRAFCGEHSPRPPHRACRPARGDLGSGWSYDIYGQYGITLYSENYQNEWSKQRVANALNVDPATGECRRAGFRAKRRVPGPVALRVEKRVTSFR